MRLPEAAGFGNEENTYTGTQQNSHYVLTMAGVK
jgi:hypothetical protein